MFLGLLGQPCGLNLIKLGLSYICQDVMPRILSTNNPVVRVSTLSTELLVILYTREMIFRLIVRFF